MRYQSTDGFTNWVNIFVPLVDSVVESEGLPIPPVVRAYLVAFLATWAQRTDFMPEPSFAERFMTLGSVEEIKLFADQCLFCVSLFPNLGARRGIPTSYYADLGATAYARVHRATDNDLFALMSRGFDPCAHVISHTVKQHPLKLWGNS